MIERDDDRLIEDDDPSLDELDEAAAKGEARRQKPVVELSPQPMFQTLFEQSVSDDPILMDFARYVVGPLSDHFGTVSAKGGAFFRQKEQEGAKNTERYSRDQSLRAHLINGMLPARRIAQRLAEWKAEPMRHWDATAERLFIAGFMLHDFTKIRAAKQRLLDAGFVEMEPPSERQIPVLEDIFREWCGKLGLDVFLEPVGGVEKLLHDLIFVACNTQRRSGRIDAPSLLPNIYTSPHVYKLATNVSYLADLLAYVAPSPRELVAHATIQESLLNLSFTLSLPGKSAAKLVYHHVAENRGLLLNFIHNAALAALEIPNQREPLLYAPSGVVYLERYDAPSLPQPAALVEATVEQIKQKVAQGLVDRKKAVKLGKDGLRTDDVYKDVLDLREFVLVVPSLLSLIRGNAPQYPEKLVTLGYPYADQLPPYSRDITDTRFRQMAEWASLLEIHFEERAPQLLSLFHQTVLVSWDIEDLAPQFAEVRGYKPAKSEGTGIRYYWYWAAIQALARKPGISPDRVWEWLGQTSHDLASALPQDLPESALPNQAIWRDLADYVGRVLTVGGAKESLQPHNELARYTRAKAGRGGAVCAICGAIYATRKPAETAVAFQPGVYTARIRIGASENKRNLCSICALEQLLRQLFVHNLDSGGAVEGQRVRYLSFYPTYFFTPETLDLVRRAYNRLTGVRISDRDMRAALNAQASRRLDFAGENGSGYPHPLADASFWQRLDPFLMPTDETESKRVLRYSDDAQGTFLMLGLRNFSDPSDTESWVLPAFLSLVLPICLDVKVVASESGVPLLIESGELRETVWLDGAHAAIRALIGDSRPRIDDILPALARLSAAYLIHLDTEYAPPKENWHRLSPLAHALMESPLYVFYTLKRQGRDDRPIGAAQIRRYVAYAEAIFNPQGDALMSHARELVTLYRRFYRVRRPFSASSYTLLRPIDIVADTLLNADTRLFDSADALIEIARGQLHDRLESSETDAIFIRSRESEQAMREFCEKFVNDVFIGVFQKDVAALRGKQLNLLRSACEILYLDEQSKEWAERGVIAEEEKSNKSQVEA